MGGCTVTQGLGVVEWIPFFVDLWQGFDHRVLGFVGFSFDVDDLGARERGDDSLNQRVIFG